MSQQPGDATVRGNQTTGPSGNGGYWPGGSRWRYGLALLVLLLIFTSLVITTPPGVSNFGVMIGFLGYTNDVNGRRFGVFGITNEDRFEVQRLSPAVEIEGMPGLHAPIFNPNLPWLRRTPLRRGGSQTIAVGVPLEPGKWRLSLRFQRRTVPERLRDYLISHGHPVPVAMGRLTILGPPEYSSTNSAWLTN